MSATLLDEELANDWMQAPSDLPVLGRATRLQMKSSAKCAAVVTMMTMRRRKKKKNKKRGRTAMALAMSVSVCRERMMQGKESGLMLVRQLLLHTDDNRRCSCCPQCQLNHNNGMLFSSFTNLWVVTEREPNKSKSIIQQVTCIIQAAAVFLATSYKLRSNHK